ncbi:16S rRNA (adenine(1518)-N(6)/adenine(1519)-N(6))-dimethyltransferase RsmA [Fumia xinanensis]|uniref:Ribosomal RNA small subunit methyltransferase A n=1 Tax=Fumia xinanensis TaxID=2763659 RepID=A0A926E698_9FIRM|nr:16S rRNA (adenine(1518)-N(6)/adenine(1519)-N(6))-dimethyltransferase RsmA [Fumia xinanensis]MBC8560358.1 16S rRNA (adenine(1518)-N(6)/adenine(1519)-N(6))-dimethyltransferase RsmA [Fumia xinanensis]
MENLSNISTIREIMDRFGFQFSKSLGQNFLINPGICPKIAEMGGAAVETGVLEIGTGFGVLTHELAKRAKKVVAVELDSRLLPVLDYTLSEHKNVKVINQDILKVDLHKLIEEEFQGMDVYVCANLPYYITSPVIMALLEQSLPIKAVTVMVQKEAAVRLCANLPSRDCGAVTVAVRYYSEPRQLFTVSRGSFMPAPNVDSAVIRLDVKKDKPLSGDAERRLFAVVKGAFSQRRKMLCNTISSSLSVSKEQVSKALKDADIKETARAEELSLDDFIQFSNCLYQTTEEGF